MISFGIHTGKDLDRISRGLRRMDNREIKKRFTRELRAAARPLLPIVRASIRAIPATSGQHTGLRRRLARAVRLIVRTSGRNAQVAIYVDPSRMPTGQRALPAEVEGSKRWRHPVYGGDTWVTQQPYPYFYRAIRPLGPASKIAVADVVRRISKDIT